MENTRDDIATQLEREFNVVQAANDNLIVMVPVIEEKTKEGIFKGDQVLAEEAKSKRNEIYVVSVGPMVQDKNIQEGDMILVDGQVTILPKEIAECPLVGFDYAKVKAYHVFAVLKNKDEI